MGRVTIRAGQEADDEDGTWPPSADEPLLRASESMVLIRRVTSLRAAVAAEGVAGTATAGATASIANSGANNAVVTFARLIGGGNVTMRCMAASPTVHLELPPTPPPVDAPDTEERVVATLAKSDTAQGVTTFPIRDVASASRLVEQRAPASTAMGEEGSDAVQQAACVNPSDKAITPRVGHVVFGLLRGAIFRQIHCCLVVQVGNARRQAIQILRRREDFVFP